MTTHSLIKPTPDDVAAVGANPLPQLQLAKTWDIDGIDAKDLPEPVGWRILIEPIDILSRTAGGIDLPDNVMEAAEYVRYVGLVVKMGDACYRHRKFSIWDADSGKTVPAAEWCREGQWVVFGRYAGQVVTMRGDSKLHTFRFVNDDEILAVAHAPRALVNYVS